MPLLRKALSALQHVFPDRQSPLTLHLYNPFLEEPQSDRLQYTVHKTHSLYLQAPSQTPIQYSLQTLCDSVQSHRFPVLSHRLPNIVYTKYTYCYPESYVPPLHLIHTHFSHHQNSLPLQLQVHGTTAAIRSSHFSHKRDIFCHAQTRLTAESSFLPPTLSVYSSISPSHHRLDVHRMQPKSLHLLLPPHRFDMPRFH